MAKGYKTPVKQMEEAAERQPPSPHVVTLSNGVKVLVKRVPSSVMTDVVASLRAGKPKPPIVHIEKLGRDEPNEDDPDYREAFSIFQANQAKKMNDTMLMLGTEFVSCPKAIPAPEKEDIWMDGLEDIGVNIGKPGSRSRYLAWLKTTALANDADIRFLALEVGRMSGITEEDVATATATFPGDKGSPADTDG